MNILDMVNLRDMTVMTTETAISLRWLTAAMGRSELRFLRIASLLLSLRLLKNVKKTFQILTRRLYPCIISPILYIDAIHYSVRDNGVIRKLAAYVILGINTEGKKTLVALEQVTEKWTPKYPNAMKRWKDNWDVISPIFKFSSVVRKVIYTTNAIESLNSTYRKLNRQRSVFPSDTALLKALYLATFEATKKWTATIRNRAQVYGELTIMYEGRLPE